MLPKTMKAIQFTRAKGGMEERLRLSTSSPLPPTADSLKKDEILVKVISAAINPADHKFAETWPISSFVSAAGSIPGMDFAGRAIATGPFSETLAHGPQSGQLVFGKLSWAGVKFGTLAEYVVVQRSGCAIVPEGVDIDQAACVGTAGLTAYQCIVPYVKAEQRIFINGGSGGCGTFGIQFAKVLGCEVVVTCSTRNIELCRGLGADYVIDYRAQNVLAELRKIGQIDHVVDFVKQPTDLFWQAHTFTNPGARYMGIAGAPSVRETCFLLSRLLWPGFLGGGKRKYVMFLLEKRPEDFARIAQWLQEGKVKSVIGEQFELSEEGVLKAYAKSKSGTTGGRLLIKVSADEA